MRTLLLRLSPLLLLGNLGIIGCSRQTPPEAPISSASQMCCAKGDVSSGKFGGCIEGFKQRQCPEDHPLWIRGVISCGPVDEAACLGGRCCEFGQAWGSEDSTLDWDPPGEETQTASPEPEPEPETDTQAAEASDSEDAPAD